VNENLSLFCHILLKEGRERREMLSRKWKEAKREKGQEKAAKHFKTRDRATLLPDKYHTDFRHKRQEEFLKKEK